MRHWESITLFRKRVIYYNYLNRLIIVLPPQKQNLQINKINIIFTFVIQNVKMIFLFMFSKGSCNE